MDCRSRTIFRRANRDVAAMFAELCLAECTARPISWDGPVDRTNWSTPLPSPRACRMSHFSPALRPTGRNPWVKNKTVKHNSTPSVDSLELFPLFLYRAGSFTNFSLPSDLTGLTSLSLLTLPPPKTRPRSAVTPLNAPSLHAEQSLSKCLPGIQWRFG